MNIVLVHTLCRRVLHDRDFRRLILERRGVGTKAMVVPVSAAIRFDFSFIIGIESIVPSRKLWTA